MDEIGRRALTDAFIHFAKETGRRRRFLYNPAMDAFASPEFRSSCYEDESYPEDSVRHAIPKCPSAPNIHHHKLYHSSTLPAMTVTLASVSASASSCQSQQVENSRQLIAHLFQFSNSPWVLESSRTEFCELRDAKKNKEEKFPDLL